jgi:hypothetical protein
MYNIVSCNKNPSSALGSMTDAAVRLFFPFFNGVVFISVTNRTATLKHSSFLNNNVTCSIIVKTANLSLFP